MSGQIDIKNNDTSIRYSVNRKKSLSFSNNLDTLNKLFKIRLKNEL